MQSPLRICQAADPKAEEPNIENTHKEKKDRYMSEEEFMSAAYAEQFTSRQTYLTFRSKENEKLKKLPSNSKNSRVWPSEPWIIYEKYFENIDNPQGFKKAINAIFIETDEIVFGWLREES
jgi:hypothetical protein